MNEQSDGALYRVTNLQDGDYKLGGVYHRVESGVVYTVPTISVTDPVIWDRLVREYGEAVRVK